MNCQLREAAPREQSGKIKNDCQQWLKPKPRNDFSVCINSLAYNFPVLAQSSPDKGYDSRDKRAALRKRGIRPQLLKRVWKTKKNRGRPIKISVPRFQQERCFAWYQRKYRRLVVRWERISDCFNAFLSLATIHIWINRILLVG